MKTIKINQAQKEFILKAITGLYCLYDFENTTEGEFKDTYNLSKKNLLKEIEDLREVLN